MAASQQAHQLPPEFLFKPKIPEPFNPSLCRLDSGQALPDGVKLTQAAKRLHSHLLRQWLAATSRGRTAFKARLATLAEDLQLSERTIRRGIEQLESVGLVVRVRTGRASWFTLRPLPEPKPPSVDNHSSTSGHFGRSSLESTNKKPNVVTPTLELIHINPDKRLLERINARFEAIGFQYFIKGRQGPLPVADVVERFGVSWILRHLERAEDGALEGTIRNPGGFLKRALERCLKRRLKQQK